MTSIVMEEYELLEDSKYRNYMTMVDRALKAFESTTEWADLIAALGKLNKVLVAHMKYPIVPRRILISKRLAQCMHPALPSGVHLKALDTYDIIFKCMGTNRLAQELFLYSAGLFPLLSHAAMNVRSALLTVYETHFVPLGERLRPALNGLLIGVLPGLEEGTDHFDRTNRLLESICEASHPPIFYGALWECVASNQSIRLPAITFVLAHVNKRSRRGEGGGECTPVADRQSYILGNDRDVTVRAACAAVQDSSVLVQRNALDLLLVLFPIHEKTLGQPEMVSVVTAACCVLLRRDMSLNRRLFGWLLGTNSPVSAANKRSRHVRQESVSSINSEGAAEDSDLPSYFEFYARHLLVDAVRAILRNSLSAARNEQKPDLKPFRLLSTLFDKAEIGQTIVDDVIIDVFRTMFHSYHMDVGSGGESGRRAANGRSRENASAALQRQKKNRQELVKSANMLFGEMDSGYIWDFCGSAFERASAKKYRINDSHTSDVNEIGSDETSTVIEMCAVVDFLLDVISIETYVETHSEHLPALFKKVATVIKDRCEVLTPKEITRALTLAKKLLSKVQPAWNAWDVAKEAAKGASDSDSANTASDAGGVRGSVESANAMWNEIGKENMTSDANGSPPELRSNASVSPEVGREATESLSPQNSDGVRSPHFPLQRQTTHAARVHQAHETLMQECSSAFQDFFVRLMSTRLFPPAFSIDAYVSKMVRRPNDTLDDRTRHLETLLEASDDAEQLVMAMQNEEVEEKAVQELLMVELPLDRDALDELSEALATTCQVLVDLSTVPTVCISNEAISTAGLGSDVGCPPSHLPAWLQYLLACSCLLTHRHAQFQLQCVSTLLEIVGLLQSTMSVTKARRRSKGQPLSAAPAAAAISSPSGGSSTTGEASYAIVMMPLIKEQHYQCVVKQTVVPQVIAAKLWDGLGGMDPVFHLRCVSLLYQLHNLVPNPKAIERILARSLERENDGCSGSNVVDSYQRFSTLWHLSRDLDVKAGSNRRNFDICLLKMLDNLNLSTGPLRALSQSWLVHAMARGDIARLMEPLFITLLDPSTARVSVLHGKVEQLEGVESADIFAVTTLGKEVIYHVAAAAADGADRAKRLFALNKFRQLKNDDAEAAAGGSGADSLETTSSGTASKRPELNSMPLAVNPFALVPPEVDEYENFTRGYGPTNAETSSSSSSSGGDSDSEREETTQGSSPISELGSRKMDSMTSNSAQQFRRSASSDSVIRSLSIHPLHSHLLLYCQVSDSRQILYTMECIKNIIKTNPRLAICTLSTTNLNPSSSGASGSYGSRSAQIQMLLARHRKSVFGKNFVGSVPSENMATYRNATLVEVLLSTLLYYLRSYYPNLAQTKLSTEEIKANREVQLMAIDILYLLVAELISVVQDNGRAYATYIADLFSRCKVQKVVLHSLLAGINDMRDSPKKKDEAEKMAFTDSVLAFNEIYSNQHGVSASERISNYSEAFQVQVLRLLLSLVILEQAINQQRGGEQLSKLEPAGAAAATSKPATPTPTPSSMSATGSNNLLRYHNDHVIPDQPMFLAAVVSALRQEKMRHLHSHWTSLVTSTLPFLGKSLSQTVLEVTAQLSRNLENLAPFYAAANEGRASRDVERSFGFIPADYVVTQLEALTMIYHYCLLDQAGNQAVVNTSFSQSSHPNPAAKGVNRDNSSGAEAALLGGEILTNLLHVFLSNTETNTLAARNLETPMSVDTMAIARKILLSTLPKLVNTSTILWMNLGADTSGRLSKRSLEPASILVGTPKTVKARLLDLLSPIAKSHPIHFLSAVGIVWQEKRDIATVGKASSTSTNSPLPVCNVDQRNLVGLCGSIRSLPVVSVISTVRQVIKAPPNISAASGGKDSSSLEISVLQFFYAYLAQCSPDQVFESWSSLSGLLRDCLALAPPAIFLALSIVNQFVHRSPSPLTDRKDQKELQDIVGRLVDASAQIAGSCLEQTTWLRRNLEVNTQLLQGEAEIDEKAGSTLPSMPLAPILAPVAPELLHLSDAALAAPRAPSRSSSSSASISEEKRAMTAFSVPALALLGELLAPLLDIIYHSDEKEKVVPLLYSVMDYVVPYLRNHSRANVPSYRACSKLLAALSEYQYTRRAWKKDGMELLLDVAFFQTDLASLAHWRVTVDNLMTHDKTTFKELMTKISAISQSSSLSLFSSKEQEMEQRALLLRRLAFVIFCSDVDQYQKQMPDIQERMVESLRTIPCSAEVRAAVFLCFRVVLVRMSAAHVTSMWPLIITEMVQIFSDLEQELSTDSEEWSSHLKRMSTLDSAWVMTAGYDGLAAHNSPAWMSLYLAVCKLLDLALVLPAHILPQFQMYRWAFVSEGGSEAATAIAAAAAASVHNGDLSADGISQEGQLMHLPQQDFVPYVVRVAKLLLQKMDNKVEAAQLAEGQPQLTMTSITSLDDLAPFFASICENVTRQIARNDCSGGGGGSGSLALSSDMTERIDRIIEADFLEALPRPVASKTAEAV